jgi:hypothetical protein
MVMWHLSQDWVSCGSTNNSRPLSDNYSRPKLRGEVALFKIGDLIFSKGSSKSFQGHALHLILTLSHMRTFLGYVNIVMVKSESESQNF